MWKWTGRCRPWRTSQNGSHAGSAKSGAAGLLRVAGHVDAPEAEGGDALGLLDAQRRRPTPA